MDRPDNLKIFLGHHINYLSIWPFMCHPWFPTRKASKLTFVCFQHQVLNTMQGLNNSAAIIFYLYQSEIEHKLKLQRTSTTKYTDIFRGMLFGTVEPSLATLKEHVTPSSLEEILSRSTKNHNFLTFTELCTVF